MKHEIEPFNPDKIYEMVISVHFSLKARSPEEATEKVEALLSAMDADRWQIHRVREAEN
ncbi:hypothetical protein V0288_06635 [Pannus brasiliensis CCIBt3594]|uniref:Uncharacterized protein n=1 Tax=Pannus brasiliensis CCIBt3594 TaxID=1427578 RepID=A0AAW9QS68_9CHRO